MNRSIMGKDDGREAECLAHVRAHAERGNPQSVLREIDRFARTSKWMMNVGDVKGEILKSSLLRANPQLVLELGAYCGYSAITMASTIAPEARVVTVEMSEEFAQITQQMCLFAGVGHQVKVINGTVATPATLQQLKLEVGSPGKVDFVFLDHYKEAYLPDLKTLVGEGFLHPGSVVFADNCLVPGAPAYVAYMDQHADLFSTTKFNTQLEYQEGVKDVVLESILLPPAKSNI